MARTLRPRDDTESWLPEGSAGHLDAAPHDRPGTEVLATAERGGGRPRDSPSRRDPRLWSRTSKPSVDSKPTRPTHRFRVSRRSEWRSTCLSREKASRSVGLVPKRVAYLSQSARRTRDRESLADARARADPDARPPLPGEEVQGTEASRSQADVVDVVDSSRPGFRYRDVEQGRRMRLGATWDEADTAVRDHQSAADGSSSDRAVRALRVDDGIVVFDRLPAIAHGQNIAAWTVSQATAKTAFRHRHHRRGGGHRTVARCSPPVPTSDALKCSSRATSSPGPRPQPCP